MKKVLLISLAVLLLAGCGEKKEEPTEEDNKVEYKSILEHVEYSDIELDNIQSITVTKYTVGGAYDEEITDSNEIENTYIALKSLKVGEKVDMSCEDNTTIYKFNLIDGNSYSIEIECDWFVIGSHHYEIVK